MLIENQVVVTTDRDALSGTGFVKQEITSALGADSELERAVIGLDDFAGGHHHLKSEFMFAN